MLGSGLHQAECFFHEFQQLHGMPHLCQTIGDSLAVCFVVEVDGEINEVGDRFPVTVETFFFHLADSGAGSAHGGRVELQQGQGLFNIFVCHCSCNIELL